MCYYVLVTDYSLNPLLICLWKTVKTIYTIALMIYLDLFSIAALYLSQQLII